MIEKTTLARPYAKAVFEIAHQDKSYSEWSNQLEVLSQITKDPQVQDLLRDVTLPAQRKAEFYKAVGQPVLNEPGENLVQLLAAKRRLVLLPYIATLFESLRAEAEHEMSVELSTAIPLEESQLSLFMSFLEKHFNKTIRIKTVIDHNLIGGYQIRMGDVLMDASLKGSLAQLKLVMGG